MPRTAARSLRVPASGFFAATAKHRVVVVLTDGESRPFDPGALGRALAGVGLVVVGVRGDGEAVFLPSGRPEPGYRSDPAAGAALATLAGATNGRPFGESDLRAASARLQQLLGNGPTAAVVSRSPAGDAARPVHRARRPRSARVSRPASHRRGEKAYIGGAMMRGLRSSRVLGPLVLVLLLGGALTSASAGTKASGPNVGWGGFGNTPNELRHSAADADHEEQRRQPRARRDRRLPCDRRGRAARRAVVSRRRERDDVRDDERRQRLGARRDDRQGQVALPARTTAASSRTSASSRTAASRSATASSSSSRST